MKFNENDIISYIDSQKSYQIFNIDYTQKEIKPYVGIGIIHGHSEFRSTENMRFSGNLIKAFSGFEYFYNQLLISTELGLAGSQTYQNLSISYLF